jgi:ParB-like chromosome segregation protein Spo0J
MKIENVKSEKLIPYEFNNKIHDETQVNRIANSIREFGFLQPLVIDQNNVIIVGHGRFEASQKL